VYLLLKNKLLIVLNLLGKCILHPFLGPHEYFFNIVVRGTIFGVLYILVGKRIWFFPNILAEEATLRELFRFWPKKDEEERPKWTTRIFYAVVAVLFILLLRHHAPDEAARARYVLNILNEFIAFQHFLRE
jgi:translocation protein SEC62